MFKWRDITLPHTQANAIFRDSLSIGTAVDSPRRHYTGSLFHLTNIACHFVSLQTLGPPTLAQRELREVAKALVFRMIYVSLTKLLT